MGTKMGMHHPVTLERFTTIKQALNKGMQNNKAAKEFGFSLSTIQRIRRSKDYHTYRIRADKQIRSRQAMVVIAPKSGLPYEDFGRKPIFSSSKPLTQKQQDNLAKTNALDRASDKTASMVGLIFIGWIILLVVFFGVLIYAVAKMIIGTN